MSFTSVAGKDDHELEDAVRRGVADGLARMLGVPKHPASVQALLDVDVRSEAERVQDPVRATVGSAQTTR